MPSTAVLMGPKKKPLPPIPDIVSRPNVALDSASSVPLADAMSPIATLVFSPLVLNLLVALKLKLIRYWVVLLKSVWPIQLACCRKLIHHPLSFHHRWPLVSILSHLIWLHLLFFLGSWLMWGFQSSPLWVCWWYCAGRCVKLILQMVLPEMFLCVQLGQLILHLLKSSRIEAAFQLLE